MKCPGCGRSRREKKANFCSNCGTRLSQPAATQDTPDAGPKSLVTDVDNAADKAYDSTTEKSDKSPKRPNEDMNPKKKKKKRKKSKKKKDDNISSDTDQSDLSLVPIEDKNEKKDDVDCESGDIAQESFHGSKEDQSTPEKATTAFVGNTEEEKNCDITEKVEYRLSQSDSMEDNVPNVNQTSKTTNDSTSDKPGNSDVHEKNLATMKGNPQNPSAINHGDQTPESRLGSKEQYAPDKAEGQVFCEENNATKKVNSEKQCATKQGDHRQGQNKSSKPNTSQKCQKTQGNNQPSTYEQTTPTVPENKAAYSNDKNINNKNTMKNKESEEVVNQTKMDLNANESPTENKTEPTKQQKKNKGKETKIEPNQTEAGKTKQRMMFGPQAYTETQGPAGSSVDLPTQVENMEVQHPAAAQEAQKTEMDPTKGSKESITNVTESTQSDQEPKRPKRNQNIDAQDRLTIYFHAVLSKDFKIDPSKDHIFIQAGRCIGSWGQNIAELDVTRDFGEHGYLVEGHLVTSKSKAKCESIPYKYVVFRGKKKKAEYEYIYKLDCPDIPTNRCLFVKEQLLNDDGDWHQYDDIICVQPEKGFVKSLIDSIWPQQRRNLIKGREIAGNIMLEIIFDHLRNWSDINLKNFQIQLNQFFEVYADPFVYEKKLIKWQSLGYGKDDVKQLLKKFMLSNMIPQLVKDGNGRSLFVDDPIRAAVIMLHVCSRYGIALDGGEISRLCTTLCLPKLNQEEFLKYWTQFSHDANIVQNLTEHLMKLINNAKSHSLPHWILVLPMVHLLKGTAKPYEALILGNTKSALTWAGLEGIQMQNQYISSHDRRSLVNLMKNNLHLRDIDALVVRSWLYLMSLDELLECSITLKPELLDILHIFASKVPREISYSSSQKVSNIITHVYTTLIEDKYSYFTENYRSQSLNAAVKLLQTVCKSLTGTYYQDYNDIPVSCMHLVVSVSDFVFTNMVKESPETKEQQCSRDLLCTALSIMRDWISQHFRGSLLKGVSEIDMWSNIISIQFKDDIATTEWRQNLTKDFEGKYKQELALRQIEYYCENIEHLEQRVSQHVYSCIERCALDAVTSLCQTKSEGKLLERFALNWFGKFGKLMSAIIQKSWPKDCGGNYCDDEDVILRHLLSWAASKNIFQLYVGGEGVSDKLSEVASERIAIAITAFTGVVSQLVHGNIKIGLLNIILENKDAFSELIKIDCLSTKIHFKDAAKMKRLLQQRQAEVRGVNHEKELVDILLTMCHKLEEFMLVDEEDLKKKQQVNIEATSLDNFMEVHQFDQIPSDMAGVVTYFDLEKDIRDMAEAMYTFRDSHIFKVCWEKQARAFSNEENPEEDEAVLLETIYEEIFQVCFEEYTDIYTSLKNGSITLEKVDKLFGDFKGNYEGLTQDLEIMCHIDRSADKQWILNRVQQIEQFHELHLAVASAEIIMRVKRALRLQGDFSVLETLIKVNQANLKRVQLSKIDNDLMQAKKDLVDITKPRKDCLHELGLRGHFVDWVKDALEDINELKVFVDLASISAGENDMDVDRVACFHDAVLGYSSMLYELKPDSNFHTFKTVVQKLWRALENDCNLPKKLRDSARHLEWLKTVKDSHGSVELSSLSLASSINKKGIYLISAQTAKKISLETALKLHIPDENEEGRNYSLEDLRELQNKLMLMSGKGDQGQHEVDHFAEIFDSVQRLSEAFIALHTAGNPLFRHWEAQISCSIISNKPSIMMDFNLEGDFSAVIIDGNIEEQLPDLCRKMEKCLEYWMDFMDKQRSLHYFLNYYSAEQIVYLCSNLSPQKNTVMDDQTLMMLSFIKPDCSTTDLRQVWHELQYEILNQPQERNEDIDFLTFTMSELSDVSSELDLLPSLTQQINGLQKFDMLWNTYMKDMKSFLPNILDVRTLGRLLEILASKETESEDESDEDISDDNITKYICRELPNGLMIGKPNLVVCPQEDILTSCISTYMNSRNEPLPTYDEVLLCTSITPYEQVELFLRRCLSAGYRGKKIYSLLYADVLSYDVSSKVECFFQRIKMQSRSDYRLVMFCSSNREHAYLPSAFSQYKVHIVPQSPLARIQEYLHKHYVVPESQCSAAAAFKDRLCVGIISSQRAGVGKSLFIKRLYHKLGHSTRKLVRMNCIRLIEPRVDENTILQSLLNHPEKKALDVFHFDVTSSVQKDLNEFLFKLLILRCLMDSEGKVWKCNDRQLYVIEMLKPAKPSARQAQNSSFTDVFPNVFCRAPKEVLEIEMRKYEDPNVFNNEDPLMDDGEFRSAAFQRPYQYLTRFHNHADLDKFSYNGVEGSHGECLQMLLMHCGIIDPSWAELRNFAWFLNLQLQDCETSVFCNADFIGDTLIGFKRFVVDFMILMAKDFATPSLSITDQSPGRPQMDLAGVRDEDLAPFLIRKRWETEPHPYIFFNDDHVSMTFIGFHLQPNDHNFVDAIDPASGRVIKRNVMTKQLYDGLMLQRVPFNIDFDHLPRGEKIERMCNVLGIQWPLDPDETYELTTDNILKILAIHMRFRCGIPVIIMGETGCGKTRLIKFLCELQKSGVATENMKLVKVHGGTTSDMIYNKVKEAESMAAINRQDYDFDSVLFFDEANTTEAISSIKEVLCDKTIKGEDLTPGCGLQIIAACNPYRKHTDEMIERLESAGLGYRVRAEETDEKLGSIPLRQLVYRVHALPPSMIPLVWDFGQLNDDTEKIYIRQIVQRVVESQAIDQSYIEYITNVLSASQRYMRKRKDECSFVSLRDVERCMQAFVWFLDHQTMFFAEIEHFVPNQTVEDRDAVMWSLVMAIGVCYHASLENKDNYRRTVSRSLPPEYTPVKIMEEISLMQDLLLSGVPMGNTIAKNSALKENVFMMVLCIELRIPLFIVGKPGSSKSLSKTLVADAMQGQAAHSNLYKRLKQIHLVSFQCSPHSTPEGIINTFKQCGRFQEGKNLKEYISVVVLDEIGLAEDSPKMPLKTLHPLLEEGCIDDEPLPHKKVGFIGISNWALDPAKMNRGIFVSRGDPDEKELLESAKGICSSDAMVLEKVRDFFQPFSCAYLEVCERQGNGFFGLRDYYSLVKMIFAVARTSHRKPSAEEIIKAVLRNFSGRDDIDAVNLFNRKLQIAPNLENISTIEFVKENIEAVGQDEECRYLLVLTKNYAALQILQQTFFHESRQPEIIFGSSFPKDQEYTQICRNINRVKICMETGQTVVLLNLQNLYESLYDALNQYYVYLGGQKYVDLGLGTHRVKCRVHKDFRLIVIEEKEVVYKQFPIPLINRLEKHYLDINTVLKSEQERIVSELEKWVELFVSFGGQQTSVTQMHKYTPADVFIGYHSDTCASVVLQVLENQNNMMEMSNHDKKVVDEAKLVLLKCATPDSVVRLDCSELPKVESEHLARVFSEEQNNGCVSDYILANIKEEQIRAVLFTEVTTFSRLLTTTDLKSLEQLGLSVELLSVQQFDTEHSFLKKIRNFLTTKRDNKPSINILIVQCDYNESSQSANLIASAKYSCLNEIAKIIQENSGNKVFVYFITRLPRMTGGTSYIGFHGGLWRSVHIDDLRRSNEMVSDIKTLQRMTLGQLFEPKTAQPEAMEVDDDIYMETEQENADIEKNQTDLDNILDTTTLLRSCVQSAVGMLRDQVESGFRITRRVEILLTLLDDRDEIKGKFLQTIKKHLHTLLTTHVDNTILSIKNNWVMKEAFNIDALQEGGTFRNTLWKRIQAVVIPMLAHLVSIIDCDQNLDLLLDENCGTSLKRLWLDIFGNDKLLEITHLTVDHNSESRTMLVQNYITQKMNIGCSLPFSWRIRDYLEELWVYALQHEGQTQLEFDDFFWKTPLGRYIVKENQATQTEFYQRYLQDYVLLTMNVTCEEELQLLCDALNCCMNELKVKLEATDTVTSLPWVHAAYHEFKNRLQNLSRMICIEPQVTRDLLKNPSAKEGVEMVLDVYAAFACVEHLEPTVLGTNDQRQAWLRRVHKLQVPIELVCSEDNVRQYGERSKTFVRRVHDAWNRIFCFSLFVEHMLLDIEELEKKLAPVVLEHTKRLWQILEKDTNLKMKESFEAVIGLLKNCKEGAVECIFRFGLTLCPVCFGDPLDPVCLPCDHIYCLPCIRQWLVPGQMFCPLCIQPVNNDFLMVPSNDIRTQINKHAAFRKRCNAFFVELVSTLCFKDNSPPCAGVIHDLLSFLMLEASPSQIPGATRGTQITTKEFSPFDESIDKSPVVRSVVLKLLLKYSFDKIKRYLEHHLHSVEQSNILDLKEKTELYSLYINCLEDSMFEKICLQDESCFLIDLLTSETLDVATVDCLQQVARVRLDLDLAVSLIGEETMEIVTQDQGRSSTFLKSVKDLCILSGNNWYRVYLIRKIGSQHGVEHVQNLLRVKQMSWLFPDEIVRTAKETPIDQFLVCGPHYQTIRNAVAHRVMDGTVDGLDETCEGCKCVPQCRAVYLLLALYREVTTLYRETNTNFRPKTEQLQSLIGYIERSKVLSRPELKAFARALVTNQLGPLSLSPAVSSRQCVLGELTVHLAAVLLCGTQEVLGPLKQLALTPDNMQAAFLPSMPEDMLAVAQQAMGQLMWYYCPNGHPCTIGECGQPMETSRCVDCGAAIGGNNHKPVQGFHAAQLQGDRTQTGHILGDPRRRDNPDMMDTKSLSPVPFAVIRMVTHMAMLFGLCNNAQMISSIIKPQVADPGEFLLAHLEKDQKHLTRALGKGSDDTVSSVHLFISSLLHPPQRQIWPVPFDNQLSSKEFRNTWEIEVGNTIASQFKNLERQLNEVNTFIRSDERISASPIMKVMFGDPRLFLGSLPQNSLIYCNTVWSCREKVSLVGLTHILEQNDGKDTLPVLWRFLQKEAEYRMVKFLPDILTLQRNLVKKCQNISELCGTIGAFLQSQESVSLKAWYQKHIDIYLTTWNQLRMILANNGEIKIPTEFCKNDLDINSDFRFLLPSRRGPGLCSTALVSYLIALHNDLVYSVDKFSGEETSYKVSPADLTDLHVIRYELDRDLMPLVLSNTQYSIEKGQETLHEYDLPKIQRQIVSRFLLGKPLITLTGIPTLVNRHDRNYEVILKDVKAKIKQEPLQALTLSAVNTQLDSYSEVCEALSTLEVALGFLAMVGGDPHMQLSCYLKEVLKMGNQTPPHILKALSMCYLKHCSALWQLLASLKSERLLKLKRDPFGEVLKDYKLPLGVDERRLLTRFFSKNSADSFLLEMHEFLVLVLNKPNATDTYKPEWSLKDTLVAYIDRKDLEVPPDVEDLFPDEICLCHFVEAWKFSVGFKQERTQSQ